MSSTIALGATYAPGSSNRCTLQQSEALDPARRRANARPACAHTTEPAAPVRIERPGARGAVSAVHGRGSGPAARPVDREQNEPSPAAHPYGFGGGRGFGYDSAPRGFPPKTKKTPR